MNTISGNSTSTERPVTADAAASPMPPAGGDFPGKAALALGTAVALLFAAHFWRDRTRGLDPAVVPEAARLHWPHTPEPANAAVPSPTSPLNGMQQTQAETAAAPGKSTGETGPKTQTAVRAGLQAALGTTSSSAVPAASSRAALIDDSGALDPFYAQLWTLEQHSAPEVVTVLHYGDSPTTADLITGDVRALLQERFGDAGHGVNLAAKPWAWYGHRNVEISDKGWASSQKDATPVGRMKPGVYGLGGAIFAGGAGAQTTYTLKDAGSAPQTSVAIDYLAAPGAGTLAVSANDAALTTIDTAGSGPESRLLKLPDGTKTLKLAVDAGSVKLFGVDFRRGNSGILYDSLGLNGATTTVISRTFDPAAWAAELRTVRPSLIVINYGTNESQFAGLVQTLDKELRLAVDKTRAAAPGVPILIMSPMDRGEQGGLNDIHTNPLVPQIVAIQQRVAAETHCGFFNTYVAMGGEGTMARWYAAKPRLVTADLIHPTPQGAEYVAQLMVGAVYGGYDRWKQQHGIGVVAVADPVEAAARRKDELRQKKDAEAAAKAQAKAAQHSRPRAQTSSPSMQPDGQKTPAPADQP